MGRRGKKCICHSQGILDNATNHDTTSSRGTILLYISATTNVVSMVLVAEREEGQAYPVQRPMYYVSEVLTDAKTHYS
jgi:hypothetical protein